jgi:hypothetical protein
MGYDPWYQFVPLIPTKGDRVVCWFKSLSRFFCGGFVLERGGGRVNFLEMGKVAQSFE